MRGGLDDALDKLARRDELRRRAAGEATGTSPEVQELAEVIAAVVNRNPKLTVTVGVEGAGDPVLLHFAVEDGVVQVNVDNSVASRVADSTPKHVDFNIEVDEPDTNVDVKPARSPEAGQETRRISYDDRDRYDPGTGYPTSAYGDQTPTTATPTHPDNDFSADSAAFERRYDGQFAQPGQFARSSRLTEPGFFAQSDRFGQSDQFAQRDQFASPAQPAQPGQRGMPAPLAKPIPLKVDSKETELAAKRLSALLRDNPSLLEQSPPD